MRYSALAAHAYDPADFADPYTGRVPIRHLEGGKWVYNAGFGPGSNDVHGDGGFLGNLGSAFDEAGSGIGSVASVVRNLPIVKQVIDLHQLALKGAALLSKNPAWDIVQTGVSFIPGVGQAVSGGMAAAAALGNGASLRDAAIKAAKNALPGGPAVAAAFDVATGMVQGKKFSDAFLDAARDQVPGGELGRAAFDAARAIAGGESLSSVALSTARKNLPGSAAASQAFDQAIATFNTARRAVGTAQNAVAAFKTLSQPAALMAQKLAEAPALARAPVRQLVAAGHDEKAARDAIAGVMNRLRGPLGTSGYDYRDVGDLDSLASCCHREGLDVGQFYGDTSGPSSGTLFPARVSMTRPFALALYQRGHETIRKAMLAHGLLARIAHSTGELSHTGAFRVGPGHTPEMISHLLTGGHGDVRQLRLANPNARFAPGDRIKVPAGWLGSAVPASYTGAPSSTPETIRQGSKGAAVKQWQAIIGVTADGQFGPNTTAATKAWQAGHGLVADGIVGPNTWSAALSGATPVPAASSPAATLVPPTIREGSTGDAVKRWQAIVGTAVDGQFGPNTTAATKAFQSKNGLAADGIVGPKTWTVGLLVQAMPALPAVIASLPQVSPPQPMPTPVVATGASQLSAAAVEIMLGAFFQSHLGELRNIDGAPLSPVFGMDPPDLAGAWNDRSTAAMRTFQVWKNAQGGSSMLPTNGQPDQLSVSALQAQVQYDVAHQASTAPVLPPVAPPVVPVSLPSPAPGPGPITLPEVVITASPPPKPGAGPALAPPKPGPGPSSGDNSTALLVAGGAAVLLLGGYGAKRARRRRAA